MYSKFPFAMENLPRHQRGFGCLSLKSGCILTAVIVIVYTGLASWQVTVDLLGDATTLNLCILVAMLLEHSVTLALTVVMLKGVLKNQAELIKPWVIWKSLQLLVAVLIFVFLNATMIGQAQEFSIMLYVIAFGTYLIRFYMIVVVASCYRQLKEDSEEHQKLTSLINENWYTEA